MSLSFKNRHVKIVSRDNLWILAIFPLSQVLLSTYLFFLWMEYMLGTLMLAFIILLSALCIPVDLILLKALRQLSHRQRSLERTRMLSEQLERQKIYYSNLSQDMEAAMEMRRWIAAEVGKAYTLLDERKDEDARRQLDDMLGAVASRSKRFCDHLVVDALLEDKSQLCRKHGIRLTYALSIPENLTISGVELCTVFANVLDNAISACDRCQPASRFIDLKAYTAGGFFIFKALNSACPTDRHAWRRGSGLSEHGWGLSILRKISIRHEGKLKTEWLQDTFQTIIWLKV